MVRERKEQGYLVYQVLKYARAVHGALADRHLIDPVGNYPGVEWAGVVAGLPNDFVDLLCLSVYAFFRIFPIFLATHLEIQKIIAYVNSGLNQST